MVDQITEATVAGAVAPYGLPVDATLAGYRATLPNAKAGDILAAIMGDWYFRIPAMRLADALPFVFDTLGDGTELLLGMSPPQLLTDTMHAAWVAFASHGNCGWPTYDPETRATMRFDTKSELVEDSQRAIRALWGG